MSVLIKGMEMPKHCGYCRFRYDGICHALQKTQYAVTDCPLIALPDHGDLIDRDELKATDSWEWIRHQAPVVIPAERSE